MAATKQVGGGAATAAPPSLRRLPVYVGLCLLLSLVFGGPGYLLVRYLEQPDLSAALAAYFQGRAPESTWRQVVLILVWTVLPFYMLLMIRIVPAMIASARGTILPLLREPPLAYDLAFRRQRQLLPPLVLAVTAGVLVYPSWAGAVEHSLGPVETGFQVLRISFYVLVLGFAVWVYASAVWGTQELASRPLNIKPLFDDAMMGLKPLGSHVTRISLTYLGFIALLLVIVILGPEYMVFLVLVALLTLLGCAMIVFSLQGVHRQMLEAKQAYLEMIRRQLLEPLQELSVPNGTQTAATWDADRVAVLEAAERKVAAAPDWPLETAGLRRIGAIVASILLALVTRYVLSLAEGL